MFCKSRGHMARTLNGNLFTFERVGSECFFRTGFSTHIHPVSCYRRRIAAAAEFPWYSGYILGFAENPFHIQHFHTYILGGDIPSAKPVHKPAVGTEKSFSFVGS